MISGTDSLRIADAIIDAGILPSRYAVSKTLFGCRDEYLADRVRWPHASVGKAVVARLKSRLADVAKAAPIEARGIFDKIAGMIANAEEVAAFVAR